MIDLDAVEARAKEARVLTVYDVPAMVVRMRNLERALNEISKGPWSGRVMRMIAEDTLQGRDGVEAARERLDSGVHI